LGKLKLDGGDHMLPTVHHRANNSQGELQTGSIWFGCHVDTLEDFELNIIILKKKQTMGAITDDCPN
jgi:hypothetical protein